VTDLIPFLGTMDHDEHQDFRTNLFQRGGDDESGLGELRGPSSNPGSSPSKIPVTRNMMKKI